MPSSNRVPTHDDTALAQVNIPPVNMEEAEFYGPLGDASWRRYRNVLQRIGGKQFLERRKIVTE